MIHTGGKEHPGGAGNYEFYDGEWHNLTEFDFDAIDGHPTEKQYTIDEVSAALFQIVQWMLNDGRFQRRGVTSRALTLGFLLQPSFMGLKNQRELAARLNLSEAQTTEIIRTFVTRFGFIASHIRHRSREECRDARREFRLKTPKGTTSTPRE